MRLPDATEGERRRIASAPAFTVLLVAFVLHFTLGSQVQRANLPTGIAYGQILFFFAIPWMTVVALGLGPRSFLALAWPRARTWPWILLASAAGFFLAGGLNSLNQWLVGPEVARFFDSTRILRDRPFAEQLAIALGVTLLAPLGEEVLFRGYFLRVLRARYGTVSALLLTSAVFAAMHLNPASFLALLALGLLFGLLRMASGSLVPALVGHAVQNGLTAAAVLLGISDPETVPIDPLLALATVAVAAPATWVAIGAIRRSGEAEMMEPTIPAGEPVRFRLDRLRTRIWVWVAAIAAVGTAIVFT